MIQLQPTLVLTLAIWIRALQLVNYQPRTEIKKIHLQSQISCIRCSLTHLETPPIQNFDIVALSDLFCFEQLQSLKCKKDITKLLQILNVSHLLVAIGA